MTLYERYLLEREGISIYENEKGFCMYMIEDIYTLFITDIYVLPEYRSKHIATNLANELTEVIKKDYKITKVKGSICLDDPNWERSHIVLTQYGMRPYDEIYNMIYYIKEV